MLFGSPGAAKGCYSPYFDPPVGACRYEGVAICSPCSIKHSTLVFLLHRTRENMCGGSSSAHGPRVGHDNYATVLLAPDHFGGGPIRSEDTCANVGHEIDIGKAKTHAGWYSRSIQVAL